MPIQLSTMEDPKQPPHLDLTFKDLEYWVSSGKKDRRPILKGISGTFRSGQLTGILGPSGSGKTSFMNITAGYRTKHVTGDITMGGKSRDLVQFRRQSCYITQSDHLLPFLTVREALEAAALLKLGKAVKRSERAALIEDLLDRLRLADCQNTRTHDLSGGETKRLSIAVEMVNNPPVMFFDEPTSGLDSRNSYQCIKLLQSLARGGRIIVCTIHQPSARIFMMFDQIFGLSNGHCIYRGTTENLVPFLDSVGLQCPSYHNPADFMVEVAVGEYGDQTDKMEAKLRGTDFTDSPLDVVPETEKLLPNNNSSENIEIKDTRIFMENSSSESRKSFASSTSLQFAVLFKRTLLTIVRDMMLTKLRLGAHIVVALMIGLLYYNIGNEASKVLDNSRCLFFVVLFFLFTAMMPTILTFPLEMNVLMREHLNRWYSLKSYYIAKTVADLPFQIVFPIISVAIVYYLTDQPLELWRFCLFNFFSVMTSLVAQSIGLTIGAAFTVQEAVFLGPASIVPTLLFSGFFIQYSTIPVYMEWITYLSFVRYGFEGVVISIYGFQRENLNCSEAFCYLKSPSKVLKSMDVEEDFIYLDALMLSLFFIGIRVIGYFILRWKVRKER